MELEPYMEFLKEHYTPDITSIINSEDNRRFSMLLDLTQLQQNQLQLFQLAITNITNETAKWNRALLDVQQYIIANDTFLETESKAKTVCHVRFYNLPNVFKVEGPQWKEFDGMLVEVKGNVLHCSKAKVVQMRRKYMCNKCLKIIPLKARYDKYYAFDVPKYCTDTALMCDGKLTHVEEDPNIRDWLDYQEISVQDFSRNPVKPVVKTVILEYDLVDCCQPGDNITVFGTLQKRWRRFGTRKQKIFNTIRAISVSSAKLKQIGRNLIDDTMCFQMEWQMSIQQHGELHLRDQIVESICPQVYGMAWVKLAVALSLIGGVTKNFTSGHRVRGDCHLLMVGDPCTGKSQIIRDASKIAKRSVMISGAGCSSAGLTAAAVREEGEWKFAAGALVMADGGICCIDEFNTMKLAEKNCLHEAMEQQSISMAKAGIYCKLSTRCTILAAANPCRPLTSCPDDRIDQAIGIATPLLSRFDIVLLLCAGVDDQMDQMISKHIFQQVCGITSTDESCDTASVWSCEKLQMHFAMAKSIVPIIEKDAYRLLSNYFMMCRQDPGRQRSRTTPRFLESLVRLSQAHARLLLRPNVTVVDAVTVIKLMEMSCGFGRIIPGPDIIKTCTPLGPQLDEMHAISEEILKGVTTTGNDGESDEETVNILRGIENVLNVNGMSQSQLIGLDTKGDTQNDSGTCPVVEVDEIGSRKRPRNTEDTEVIYTQVEGTSYEHSDNEISNTYLDAIFGQDKEVVNDESCVNLKPYCADAPKQFPILSTSQKRTKIDWDEILHVEEPKSITLSSSGTINTSKELPSCSPKITSSQNTQKKDNNSAEKNETISILERRNAAAKKDLDCLDFDF